MLRIISQQFARRSLTTAAKTYGCHEYGNFYVDEVDKNAKIIAQKDAEIAKLEIDLCTTRSIIAVLSSKFKSKNDLHAFIRAKTTGKHVIDGETVSNLEHQMALHNIHRQKDYDDYLNYLTKLHNSTANSAIRAETTTKIDALKRIGDNKTTLEYLDRFRREF